jgi:hypothetical protein
VNAVGRPYEVVVEVGGGEDADDAVRAELASRLRADLEASDDVESVRLATSGDAPAGAKAGDAVMWGTLIVSVVSTGALTALITLARDWVGRQRDGSVRVKIGDDELELTAVSAEDQRRLVDEWLARREGRAPTDG